MKYLLFAFFIFIAEHTIPSLNKKVVRYVDSVIGTKVARGECWDLAAAALDHAGAYLDRSSKKSIYVFGRKINTNKERVFPGDIIQIDNVKIQYSKGNMLFTESMPHHTAIVYKVLDHSRFKIAHQNTSFSGRKVGVSELNLRHIKKGKIVFYRPYKK